MKGAPEKQRKGGAKEQTCTCWFHPSLTNADPLLIVRWLLRHKSTKTEPKGLHRLRYKIRGEGIVSCQRMKGGINIKFHKTPRRTIPSPLFHRRLRRWFIYKIGCEVYDLLGNVVISKKCSAYILMCKSRIVINPPKRGDCKGIFIPKVFWWLMTMLLRTNLVR